MYDTSHTYDMFNYNISNDVEFFTIMKYKNLQGNVDTLACQVETLVRRKARWHVYLHVGT